MAMPFCGLWRFRNGQITEHWENAYDAAEFGRFLMGEKSSAATPLQCLTRVECQRRRS